MIRIAMLGSGFVCDFFMRALRYVPGQQVVVNFSRTEARAAKFAAEWGIPEWTTDMNAAVARDDVDLVAVGLPNDAHAPACIAAAEAGKAVVCTKPLGRNGPEAKTILDAVREHGVWHGYAETEAFMPDVLRARQAVEDGAIGKVLIVRAREAHTGSHASYAWDVEKSGGGPLLGMGIHGGHDETSVMLHLRPDLVRMDRAVRRVPEGLADQTHVRFGGLTTFGWLSNDFGPDGHIGDPTGATAETGKQLFETAVELVAEQLVEISTFDFGR